jgi:hypothetical protein
MEKTHSPRPYVKEQAPKQWCKLHGRQSRRPGLRKKREIPYLKKHTKIKRAGAVVQVVEHLPSQRKTLSSIAGTWQLGLQLKVQQPDKIICPCVGDNEILQPIVYNG